MPLDRDCSRIVLYSMLKSVYGGLSDRSALRHVWPPMHCQVIDGEPRVLKFGFDKSVLLRI